MDDIRHLLDSVRRRLLQGRFLRGLHYGLVGAALLVLLVVLLTKVSPAIAAAMPLGWIIVGAALAAVVAAAAYARSVSLAPMTLAVLVDERLSVNNKTGTHERLSTALAVKDRSDGFARAAVADGVALARDKRVRESIGRAFPVRAPSNSWIGPMIACAAVGAWLLPQGDFFAVKEEEAAKTAQVKTDAKLAEEAVKSILERNEKLEKLAAKLGDQVGDNVAPDELPKTPEDVRRETIKNLTETQKKLNDLVKGDEAQALDAMKNQLANLEPQQGSDVAELSKALKEGDFKAAKDALDKLKEAAAKDPAKKDELEKQLGDLSKQIEKIAQNKENVEAALSKANLDPKLANSPEALQRALDNAKNLSQQQKQDIQKAMQAQQAAQQKLEQLSKACNGACSNPNGQKAGGTQGSSQSGQQQGQQSGSQGQQGKDASQQGKSGQPGSQQQQGQGNQGSQAGSGQMSDMLSDLESLQQMMQDAQAAMNEADKQCQGLGQCQGNMPGQCQSSGDGNQIGNRRGGHGRANGGSAGTQKSPTSTKIQKEKVEMTAGDVISRQAVEGESERGQASEQLNRVINDVAHSMEQGVTEEEVPSDRVSLHKRYFGELKNTLEAARGKAAPASGGAAGGGAGGAPASGGSAPSAPPKDAGNGAAGGDKPASAK